jgi:hypothetical protein
MGRWGGVRAVCTGESSRFCMLDVLLICVAVFYVLMRLGPLLMLRSRYGAANTDFWVDGEKGIVVVMTGNLFPWNDEEWVKFVAGIEARIYEGLEK